MLLIAFAWGLLTLSFLGWGKLLASGFGPAKAREDFPETSYLFLGLSFAGILSGIWWVFAPISELFGGLLLGGGIGYALASFPFRFEFPFRNPWFSATVFLLFLTVLMKAAAPTSHYDCGLYYVQTVRWMQNFPALPGLGNVHIRFGNASAWHMLGAAFNWPSLFHGEFDDLGELILFWFLLFHVWYFFILEGFERYLSLGMVLFALWQAFSLVSAPTPDLAVGIIGMQTLWQFRKFLRLWNPRQPNQLNTRGLALFVQSLFLAQIKLSAIPFLVISAVVVFLIVRERWYFRVFQLVFLGGLVAFSIVARSYILTGYTVYPVVQLGTPPDWTIPKSQVTEYIEGVRGFARHILTNKELESGLSFDQLGRLSFWEWFPVWASDRTALEWFCMLSGVFGWILLVLYASSRVRTSFKSHWPLIFFTWLCGMMLLFWFSNAPDIRFGVAILGTGFSYAFASVFIRLDGRFSFYKHPLVLQSFLVGVGFVAIWFYRDQRSLSQQLIFPPNYPEIQVTSFKTQGGHIMYTPAENPINPYIDADQCWNAPLPCCLNKTPGLEFRGKDMKDGFRFVEPVKSK